MTKLIKSEEKLAQLMSADEADRGLIERSISNASADIEVRQAAISGLTGFIKNQMDIHVFDRLIDPTARIHPSAKLGEGVKIGPNSVIMAGAIIGDNVVIGPNCVVGERSSIGAKTVLQDQVLIDCDVKIGERCIFGSDFPSHKNPAYHSDRQIRLVKSGTVIDTAYVYGKVYIGHNCIIKDGVIGERGQITIIGDDCRFHYDTQASGAIPPGTELLNCASMYGTPDGTTIHSSDWWRTSGLFPESAFAAEDQASLPASILQIESSV